MKNLTVVLTVSLFSSIIVYSQISEYKILPADGSNNDAFGNSVSISGDYAIVGAPGDDENSHFSGSAYIFSRNGSEWLEEKKITASDGDSLDSFGVSVSIAGNYIIVGTPFDEENGSFSGSAYIFRKDGSTWVEDRKIFASDGAEQDFFGISVSISGDYTIVGVPLDDDNGQESGSAYIFKEEDSIWVQKQKLTATDGSTGDYFGQSVSISGEYAIVSAYYDDDSSGSAYIFRRDGETWIEEQKLLATDITRGDQFGYSVSISGYNAIVGAARDDDNGLNSGSAYFFRRDSTSWVEEKKIIASDGAEGDLFGSSVSISEDFAIIGAQRNDGYTGAAYIFKKSEANWAEIQKLTASDGASFDIFGHSVSISGDNVIVGAPYDDDNGPGSGSAYIYTDFVVDVKNNLLEIPTAFNLSQNYPNPFNPSTTISWQVPVGSHQTLKIYDVLGNEVVTLVDEYKSKGIYEVEWNASGLPSGVYFYQLKTNEFIETRKMLLLK